MKVPSPILILYWFNKNASPKYLEQYMKAKFDCLAINLFTISPAQIDDPVMFDG